MKKALKIIAIALGTLAALCAVLVAAGMYALSDIGPGDPPLGPLEQRVQQNLTDALGKGATQITLAEIADFPWEQACMLVPYTGEDTLNKAAGARLRGYGSIGWIDNESYWTLAFITGKEIKAVRIPKMAIGRQDLGGSFVECAPRANAVLTYRAQATKGIPPREFYFAGRPR